MWPCWKRYVTKGSLSGINDSTPVFLCFLFVDRKLSAPLPAPASCLLVCCHTSYHDAHEWFPSGSRNPELSILFYKLPRSWCFVTATEKQLSHGVSIFKHFREFIKHFNRIFCFSGVTIIEWIILPCNCVYQCGLHIN